MTGPYQCPECGEIHPRGCRGHVDECIECEWRGSNYVGKPCHKCDGEVRLRGCRNPPLRGGTMCKPHGAGAPQVQAANARRLAQKEAVESLADVGVTPIGDPLDALAQVAAEAVALKDHFANLVAELNKTMSFETWTGDHKLDARVALYERALDRSQKFLSDWVRLGFEERKARLDDARAALVGTVILGILTELGHDLDQPATVSAIDRWLPVLDGQPTPVITVTAQEDQPS